jgi:hypothetical protein
MNAEEYEQLKVIRQNKLIELKNRLQENADSEFSEFKGKFDLVHKPLRK